MPQIAKKFVRIERVEDFPFEREPKYEHQAAFDREWILKSLIEPQSLESLQSTIPRVLSEETKKDVVDIMKKNIIHKIEIGESVDLTAISQISSRLVTEISRNPKAMLNLIKMKNFEENTFTHSINVCLIAILVGLEMGFSKAELEELAKGALFHDVGKLRVRKELLTYPGPLTEEEFSEVKQHPFFSLNFISCDEEIGEIPRSIITQHHERYDGQGYPLKLKGDKIHSAAVICALADVYDALTSKRPYRKPLIPYDAMRHIIRASAKQFSPEICSHFISTLSIYPLGSLVKLNTGEVARVIRANKETPIRPVIRLILDYQNQPLTEIVELDLIHQLHRYIVRAIDESLLKYHAPKKRSLS
ncbi:HD-GYP domain-containing protein [bacterium]|nr:HD-GYP domain-containing protein [bacterium]MBU1615417.1 HD-GYP domain-containing protein [bacterium]